MNDDLTPDFYKSRTQQKKEAKALQKLGERLLSLTAGQLSAMDIPDELRSALLDAREISSFKATARHHQYIGAIMRDCDPEPILEALAKLEAGISLKKTSAPKPPSESALWAQRILEEDAQIQAFLEAFPAADRQRLRQLKRNAVKQAGKPAGKKAKKALESAIGQDMKS